MTVSSKSGRFIAQPSYHNTGAAIKSNEVAVFIQDVKRKPFTEENKEGVIGWMHKNPLYPREGYPLNFWFMEDVEDGGHTFRDLTEFEATYLMKVEFGMPLTDLYNKVTN